MAWMPGVDAERHAVWIAKRVLEYGYRNDWQAIVVYYGKARLTQIVVGIRSLNPRAFAFCQAWFQIPATDFRCSNTTPFVRHPVRLRLFPGNIMRP